MIRLAGNMLVGAQGCGGLRDGLCSLLPAVCPTFFMSSAPHFLPSGPVLEGTFCPFLMV